MESIGRDILHGIRVLRKSPGFTLVAVLTLALGIGANTAIFSMVNSLMLRPLPVADPQQIMVLAYQQHGNQNNQFSIADYRDIQGQGQAFSGLIGYQVGMDGLSLQGKADRILTNYVTGNYFSVLGLKPALGRLLVPSEGQTQGADPVMVLGYNYWTKRFAGDPGVVGKKVSLNGHPVTIVGVAPKGFHSLHAVLQAQAYLPVGMLVNAGYPADFMSNRGMRNLTVLGRLQSGMTAQKAQASLAPLAKRLSQQYPDTDKDIELRVYPEVRARPQPDPDKTLVVVSGLFLALAVMVLLLACLNVANILLVRATVREKEMAIRAALGAARIRLIRQLLTESLLLALGGGLAGMLLGYWGSFAVSSININSDLPVYFDFGFDWRVFAYSFSAALLTGVVVGIVPAFRISRVNLNAVLHESGRGVVGSGQKLRTALVMAQVAGSLTLLIIAGLFVRSLRAAQHTNLGFDPDHVLNMSMDPLEIGYAPAQGLEFYRTLLNRVRTLPGVISASTASSTPMGYYNSFDDLVIEGQAPVPGQPLPGSVYNLVSTDYFSTMRIPIVRGRVFTESDTADAPYVAIVNETLVKRYWPNQDPIGRHFMLGSDRAHSITIVGVAANSRYSNVTGEIGRNLYMPFTQHYQTGSLQTLQVRTAAADPMAMAAEVEGVVHSLSPDLPVFDLKSMKEALVTLNGLMMYQLGAGFAAALGMLGLTLAVVGVYGVISYAAAQRTQEIGIRMALGARPGAILVMILRQGLLIVGVGLAAGVGLALACARVASSLLAVKTTDPVAYLSASAVLTLVALAACYIPAYRSMRVEPMVALRHE